MHDPHTPRQSGLGIASFILALGTGLGAFALLVVAGVLESSSPGGIDEASIEAALIGLGILGCLALFVLAFALGLASLFQSGRAKGFGIAGTVMSPLFGLLLFAVMLIGLLME